MGLHDRIATQKGLTGGPEPGSALEDTESRHVDPYAELKTNIHNACIKQLGVELLKRELRVKEAKAAFKAGGYQPIPGLKFTEKYGVALGESTHVPRGLLDDERRFRRGPSE